MLSLSASLVDKRRCNFNTTDFMVAA